MESKTTEKGEVLYWKIGKVGEADRGAGHAGNFRDSLLSIATIEGKRQEANKGAATSTTSATRKRQDGGVGG